MTHWPTHWLTGVGDMRCYRIKKNNWEKKKKIARDKQIHAHYPFWYIPPTFPGHSPVSNTSFGFQAEGSLVQDNRSTELDKAILKLTNWNPWFLLQSYILVTQPQIHKYITVQSAELDKAVLKLTNLQQWEIAEVRFLAKIDQLTMRSCVGWIFEVENMRNVPDNTAAGHTT